MTTTEVSSLKRTELQAAACRQFGKIGSELDGPRHERRTAGGADDRGSARKVRQWERTARPRSSYRCRHQPLLQAQLDEQRVLELIEGRVAELSSFIEAKLAERQTITTFEVHRPDGTRINVGRTHRQFEEVLSSVDAGCWPFLIGPAGSFKTCAAAKVAEALGRPFHMDSMSEGKTPFDLLGFNDATGKAVHTELRKAWEHGGVFLCDEMDAGNANVLATLNALLSQPNRRFPGRDDPHA